jgi:hypothetical protein
MKITSRFQHLHKQPQTAACQGGWTPAAVSSGGRDLLPQHRVVGLQQWRQAGLGGR